MSSEKGECLLVTAKHHVMHLSCYSSSVFVSGSPALSLCKLQQINNLCYVQYFSYNRKICLCVGQLGPSSVLCLGLSISVQ